MDPDAEDIDAKRQELTHEALRDEASSYNTPPKDLASSKLRNRSEENSDEVLSKFSVLRSPKWRSVIPNSLGKMNCTAEDGELAETQSNDAAKRLDGVNHLGTALLEEVSTTAGERQMDPTRKGESVSTESNTESGSQSQKPPGKRAVKKETLVIPAKLATLRSATRKSLHPGALNALDSSEGITGTEVATIGISGELTESSSSSTDSVTKILPAAPVVVTTAPAEKCAQPKSTTLRSAKRKSILPAARLSHLGTGNLNIEMRDVPQDVSGPGSKVGSITDIIEEPVAKRLRLRATRSSSPELLKLPQQRLKRAASEKLEGLLEDFEFTGSSSRLGGRSSALSGLESPTGSITDHHLRSILKHHETGAVKRRLAFIDESAEDREKLAEERRVESANPEPSSSAIPATVATIRPSNLRILSWNIAGLKSFINKYTWKEINTYLPDVICLQETKVDCAELLDSLGVHVGATHTYWHQSVVKGHAGVAILSKNKPLQVLYGLPRSGNKSFGEKGHVLTAEYERFFVVNAYVPNSSAKLKNLAERLEWDIDFRRFLSGLQVQKPFILVGDLNVALQEIDIFHPERNRKNPGFTNDERNSLSKTIKDLDLVDVFRHFYPNEKGAYTFWATRTNSRARNIGWRLDYFLVSKALVSTVCSIKHLVNAGGSDHCPIILDLDI